MAIGDIIDIGGRAYMEVQASNTQNEDTSKTYALVTQSSDSAAFGKPSDAPLERNRRRHGDLPSQEDRPQYDPLELLVDAEQ